MTRVRKRWRLIAWAAVAVAAMWVTLVAWEIVARL